jgi:uncharacterized protein
MMKSRTKLILGIFFILVTALYCYGRFVESYWITTTKLDLEIDGYFQSCGTIKIVHISDLHVIKQGKREARMIEAVQEMNPDIILITGDFIKTGADPAETIKTISQLKAPLGVWGVPGNIDLAHDKYPELLKGLEDIGVTILNNQRRTINKDGFELDLVGLDLYPKKEELQELFNSRPPGRPEIVLAHWPYLIEELIPYHPQLILCGHTHGGQIRLPVIGTFLARLFAGTHYDQGLFRTLNTWIYVNRGVGMTTHPIRLFCPPEITQLTVTFTNRVFE